jgi:simple sugar transport system permease protein
MSKALSGAVVPTLSILAALIVAGILLVVTGANPITVYAALVQGAFIKEGAFADTLVKMTPYLLLGMAVALSFTGGLFNVGAEGQFYVGALAATYIGYSITGLPIFIHLPLAIIVGASAGAIWSGIAGVLKAWRGAHEVIVTIMLNGIALSLADYLINGPMRGKSSAPKTPNVQDSAILPRLFGEDNPLHAGLILALAALVVFWWLTRRSPLGFSIRTLGTNINAARYSGINVKRTMVVTMLISGALAGIAGAVEILGSFRAMPSVFTTGYGFDGIAIALLGQGSPVGILLSSLLFGAFNSGAGYMQLNAGVQASIIEVIKALILIFVGAPAIIRGILNWQRMAQPA